MNAVQTAVSGFPEYHKIDTIFERGPDFRVNENKLKSPVIGTISAWDVTEKIDGTNVRVMLSESGEVSFGGRSNNAQMPADLVVNLMGQFPAAKLQSAMWIESPASAVLYGEGYGAGIQKGGAYRPDKGFILFDVLLGGKWWLDRSALVDVASKLGCETVPYIGRMSLPEIVQLVRNPFASMIGSATAEGIVAKPIETLFDRRGERLVIKLKTKDFQAGKR
jgi:RNA ligase